MSRYLTSKEKKEQKWVFNKVQATAYCNKVFIAPTQREKDENAKKEAKEIVRKERERIQLEKLQDKAFSSVQAPRSKAKSKSNPDNIKEIPSDYGNLCDGDKYMMWARAQGESMSRIATEWAKVEGWEEELKESTLQ
jgi:hypothetical protein